VSLILEALKKLEREKDAGGRGFLVVAPTPWRGESRGRWVRLSVLALAGGALAGAGAWGAWRALSARAPERAAGPAAPAAPSTPAVPVAVTSASAAPLPPPIWQAATPRPAARPATPAMPRPGPVEAASPPPGLAASGAATPAAALRLEAISVQDGQPVAVINGRLVRQGDTVEGALVTWIGADAVEIEVNGRRRTLGF
jgi:hypothetical protein